MYTSYLSTVIHVFSFVKEILESIHKTFLVILIKAHTTNGLIVPTGIQVICIMNQIQQKSQRV
jgi:hypothetical protein